MYYNNYYYVDENSLVCIDYYYKREMYPEPTNLFCPVVSDNLCNTFNCIIITIC